MTRPSIFGCRTEQQRFGANRRPRLWPRAHAAATSPTSTSRCCSGTNNGDGTFTDLPPWASGANDTGFGRRAAYGDFDGDGCLDLYVVNIGEFEGRPGVAKLFRNNCASGNNWLMVRAVGTLSNRDGIGATIAVTTTGSTQRRTVTAGSSQMSQHMSVAHFGLGEAAHIDTLTVRWPSGRSQTLTDVAANQVLVVTEPDG